MAITKILKIGNNSRLRNSVNYITNPLKTENSMLVNGYNCNAETAEIQFRITQLNAKNYNGDYTNNGGNNICAYHIIQSFDVQDKITSDEAHKIGQDLADEFLDGKFEYVIATHVDKDHIHNHIIVNSVSFFDNKKLRTQPYITAAKLRSISDRLCEEKNLNIIKNPNFRRKNEYLDWFTAKKNINWKEELSLKLEFSLLVSSSLDELKENLKKLDVDVSFFYDNGNLRKHPLFKYKNFKPVRGRSLIENLDIDKIKENLYHQDKIVIPDDNINDYFKKFVYEKSQKQIQLKGSEIKYIGPKGVLIEIEKDRSVFIDSKHVVINNSKISVNINEYLEYSIKSNSGNKISYKRVKGLKLIEYYNKNKNNYSEMSLTNKINFVNRKQLISETKDVANLLYVASKNNTSIKDVLPILKKEYNEFEQGLTVLSKDIEVYTKIRANLQTIITNQSVYDNYINKSEPAKILYYRQNYKAIDEYTFAVNELEKNKVDIGLDIQKLDMLIEKKKQQLSEQKKVLEIKAQDLKKYQEIISEIEI